MAETQKQRLTQILIDAKQGCQIPQHILDELLGLVAENDALKAAIVEYNSLHFLPVEEESAPIPPEPDPILNIDPIPIDNDKPKKPKKQK